MIVQNSHTAFVTTLYAIFSMIRSCPVWAFMLCVALAFAPSVKLHIHELDQAPLWGTSGLPELASEHSVHSHATEVHASTNLSHEDHHDGVVTDLEASPKALTKVLVNVLVMAVFVVVALFVLNTKTGRLFTRPHDNTRPPPARYHLVQPVRAPPL